MKILGKNDYLLSAAVMDRWLRRRRFITAFLATVLSLAVHAFVAVYFPAAVSRRTAPVPPKPTTEKFPPFEIEVRPEKWLSIVDMDYLRFAVPDKETVKARHEIPEASRMDPAVFEPETLLEDRFDRTMLTGREWLHIPSVVDIEPAQEIIEITERTVSESDAAFGRKLTPVYDRIPYARDIVMPGTEDEFRFRAAAAPAEVEDLPDGVGRMPYTAMDRIFDDAEKPPEFGIVADVPGRRLLERFEEDPESVTDIKPVDRFLRLRAQKYEGARDDGHLYIALEVERYDEGGGEDGGEPFLDVLPKDVFFIQDLSGSMGQRRVDACRRGIRKALGNLSPADRFNIITFAHEPAAYSDDWVPVTAENLQHVQPYLDGMSDGGMTDIDAALNLMLELEREPARPALALMLTDGIPTAGVTNSTRIIENFTVRNRGEIAMFAVAAARDTIANMYLLDMLTYRNRGDTGVISFDREEIIGLVDDFSRGFARPVLTGLRYRFTRESECEAYPVLLPDLYLDRPLVIYARMPRDKKALAFQVTGRAGEVKYDFVFELSLEDIPAGDGRIRNRWAMHRVYSLIGEHMQADDPDVLRRLFDTAAAYDVEVPYLDDFAASTGRFLRWW